MRTRARMGKDGLWARTGKDETRARMGKNGQGWVMGKDGLWARTGYKQGQGRARTGKDNDGLGQLELDANLSG